MGRRTGEEKKHIPETGFLKRLSLLLFEIGHPFFIFFKSLTPIFPYILRLLWKILIITLLRLRKEFDSLFFISTKITDKTALLPLKVHKKSKTIILYCSHNYSNLLKKILNIIKTKKKPKKKIVKPQKHLRFNLLFKLIIVLFFVFGISLLISFNVFTFFKELPSPSKLSTADQIMTTKIYDRNGSLLYKIYREKDRSWIGLDQIPKIVIQATLSIEDKDFYKHPGISLRGILRAAYQNIFENKKTGGSTITQQLIKNTLLTPEKTWRRKLKEIVLAIMVEKVYRKNQILEMYLNGVGYGGATYGIEEAAQKYFGKSAVNLNLAEASFLAGLPASPTLYSPFGDNREMIKIRQALVLNRMLEDGYITPEEKLSAESENLIFASQNIQIEAPHFVMYIKDLLTEKYGIKTVEQGGLEVKTSLDLNIQNTAQKIVKQEIDKLRHLRITNGAVLVTNPQTGEILAMVGSKDYFAKDIDGNYNVTTAERQPGSSIKPVNYSIALENGFTPSSLIDDSPIVYKIPGQPPYEPRNYDNRFHGQVPLRIALGSSYNVPAVKILAAFGVQRMIERGKLMGITTWNDPSKYGLSLTLGGGEVKMTDMAVVYGSLANNGTRIDFNPILEIKDSKGYILESNSTGKKTPILNPAVAYLLTNILKDNSARTPTFGSNSQLFIPNKEVAVKTGTTQNLRDNWTIGYNPNTLVAVWVGNNDNSPMSYVASGVTGASPIWRLIMDLLLEDRPAQSFVKPDNVIEISICQNTNTLPCGGCPVIKKEYYIQGTEPKESCDPKRFENPPSPTP